MLAQLNRKRIKACLSVASVLIAIAGAGVVCAPLAFAKITLNTIDTTAAVSHNGRHIRVTGPIACDQTQPVTMRVTVSQRATGAIAEGYAYVAGTIAPQQWHVHAFTLGGTAFTPGPATVVALARSTTSPGQPDDAHQWLVNVTLVED